MFRRRESRGLFYWVALDLLRLSEERQTRITTSQALAVLLQTWNSAYFHFHPRDLVSLDGELKALLSRHRRSLRARRSRSIMEFRPGTYQEARLVRRLFEDFEGLLGPVGAAKTLHLLCPQYFPIWDRRVAAAYGVRLRARARGGSADKYLQFMQISRNQCEHLGGQHAIGRNPLKALDEYNYCHYSRGWI